MQQLRVFPNDQALPEDAVFIDLYEQDPIRLTLSVEDITNTEANSVFSKTFRVPATSNNNQFFKHAFLIDGIDYDVTVKKPAQVLVDGSEFRTGHIRLQKIYINGQQDKIEYEILFLGETRDFSSKIGDKNMCELQIPDLSHVLNTANIVESWQAFPQGGPNGGLFGGDVLYPLIDHGNTYVDGVAQEARISVTASNRFTQNSHPLTPDRFKPMIRAKKVFDQIFEDAGYTYESEFLNGDLFRRLYISAFGNEAQASLNVNANSINNFEVSSDSFSEQITPVLFDIENSDEGDNFNLATGEYVVPITGSYTFEAEVWADFYTEEVTFNGIIVEQVDARIEIWVNGVMNSFGADQITPANLTYSQTLSLNAGDVVTLRIDPQGYDEGYVRERVWRCVNSPGLFNPTNALDCEYKQVDFIKDILTLFRLVMSPDPFIPNKFIIEPYIDYIYTGETYDWSDKLIREKDVEIEPLFNTQSDRIEFRFKEGTDYINDYHQKAFGEPYGYLAFDSGNELLKGTRTVNVNFAPTPIARIDGADANSTWIIPQLNTREAGETSLEHLPIKVKTRLLFYNGLLPADHDWYMVNPTVVSFDTYPQVSPYETFPQTAGGLNLNWFNDIKYWGPAVVGYQQDGITLFQKYWQSYITDLYNKFARRVTATFTLNNVDLQNFTFNDIVFVDGVYYRPEKIIDAPIGQRAPVKVQLIKAINYRPLEFDQPLVFSLQQVNVSCNGENDGAVNIEILNGIPPYQYSVTNGPVGFFATYQTTLGPFAPGTYTITITENEGFTVSQTFVITEPDVLTASQLVEPENPIGANNGAITVIPEGGTEPYTILWDDGNTDFNRTGLEAGEYEYTITDANECTYSFNVDVPANQAPLQVLTSATNPTSCGGADGSIDLSIAGGVPPYTVDWADLPGTDDPVDRTGLNEGTYTFTVTDSDSPAGVVGPQDVTLVCFAGTAFPQSLAFGTTSSNACTGHADGFINTYWTNEDPIQVNSPATTFMYNTQAGALNENILDYVSDGWYSDGTTAYQVVNGGVVDSRLCFTAPEAYSFALTSTQIDNNAACSAPLTTFYWSPCQTLASGCKLYTTRTGAETQNPANYIPNGFYGAFDSVNNIRISFEVNNGSIGTISICP